MPRFPSSPRSQSAFARGPCSPYRASGSSRSIVADVFLRLLAAISTSMPAVRTVKSSELIAVMKSPLRRVPRVMRPSQPETRAAICSFAPR